MNETFTLGSRIKIAENYHWAKNATGKIMQPPNFIIEMPGGWKGIVREIKALNGYLSFYWIKFDEPQIEADGDGPYHEAEIDSAFLNLIVE